MKSKRSIVAIALVLASAAIATETAKPTPDPEALQIIQTQIASRLDRQIPPFSRVRAPSPQTHLHKQLLVDGEQRLPFEVHEPNRSRIVLNPETKPTPRVMVSGYMRLSDQAIFIFDTKSQKHIPAEKDPRFAPQKPVVP